MRPSHNENQKMLFELQHAIEDKHRILNRKATLDFESKDLEGHDSLISNDALLIREFHRL